jgi:deoxycytidylate deaminase
MEVYIKDVCLNDWQGLQWATECASKSLCLSRHVGAAILVTGGIPSFAYNRAPAALASCSAVGTCNNNERGQCTRCIHAESWAIKHWDTQHRDATIYITCPPCHACALEIIHANIRRVVCYTHPKTDREAVARLLEAGVEFIEVMP